MTTKKKAPAKKRPAAKAKPKTPSKTPSKTPVAAQLVAAVQAAPPPPPAPLPILRLTHVVFLLDGSGSMWHLEEKVRELMTKQLDVLAANASDDAMFRVHVHVFGSHLDKAPHADLIGGGSKGSLSASRTRVLRYNSGNGGTRLNGSIIDILNDGALVRGSWIFNPKTHSQIEEAFLYNILTDGENTERQYTVESVAAAVKREQARDDTTITVMCPPGSRLSTSRNTGIPVDNIIEWEATTRGIEQASVQASAGLSSFLQARAKGVTRSTNYYQVDAAQLKKSDVVKKAEDVTHLFRRIPVKAECTIKECVENARLTFEKKRGYYQVTKKEREVQATKDLLVRKRGEKTIYGGPNVRAMVGLPVGVSCKVEPGNLGEWEVFIRSDSDIRKLVRGTDLLYLI